MFIMILGVKTGRVTTYMRTVNSNGTEKR